MHILFIPVRLSAQVSASPCTVRTQRTQVTVMSYHFQGTSPSIPYYGDSRTDANSSTMCGSSSLKLRVLQSCRKIPAAGDLRSPSDAHFPSFLLPIARPHQASPVPHLTVIFPRYVTTPLLDPLQHNPSPQYPLTSYRDTAPASKRRILPSPDPYPYAQQQRFRAPSCPSSHVPVPVTPTWPIPHPTVPTLKSMNDVPHARTTHASAL